MEGKEKEPILRDIKRYYCEYCGICRSKKSLIASHVLSCHKEEEQEKRANEDGKTEEKKPNTCEECGASFQKPAYLKQHMQSHSLERPFICHVDDCRLSYRRKDHLTRHLLLHEGKLFTCPIENCSRKFTLPGNIKRHVKGLHKEISSVQPRGQKQYICKEIGCGKVFKCASRLQKHEDSHVKLESVEALCSEPGCLKYFSNVQCLRAHIESCHRYITCEICKTKQLKKCIKRHLRTHEAEASSERIKCGFKGCLHTFSNKSNLQQHVKAVHLQIRPYACRMAGCGSKFPFKHVRDNHEKSGLHVHTHGDFEESDEQFRSRPRGGRKRKRPTVETLLRKRVALKPSDSALSGGREYLSWLLSEDAEE